jgi:hypothetical protein
VERDLNFRKELSMKEQTDHEVVYYYDLHPTEEDLLGKPRFMPRSSTPWWRS